MGNFIVTVNEKHPWVVLNKDEGIKTARVLMAQPRNGLDFRVVEELMIKITVDNSIELEQSLAELVPSKKKKKKVAVIEKEFDSFNNIHIVVYHTSKFDFKFLVDIVVHVH